MPDINPEEAVAKYVEFAQVQLFQANLVPEPTSRADMMDEAKDLLLKAEKLRRGSGSYLLAAISAQNGNRDLCRKWLMRAFNSAAPPKREAIEKDALFASVRKAKWFKRLLSEL